MATEKWEAGFDKFVAELKRRMSAGHAEYGDASFEREAEDLIGEITEELMDVCGWSYILYLRLEAMKRALEEQ